MAVALGRELIREIRGLDEYDLRRLLIFAAGLLDSRTGTTYGVHPSPEGRPGPVSYRRQWVRCGKKGCTTCPHGPYWYGYWRESGRLRSRYVGKELPDEAAPSTPGSLSGIRPPPVHPPPG